MTFLDLNLPGISHIEQINTNGGGTDIEIIKEPSPYDPIPTMEF